MTDRTKELPEEFLASMQELLGTEFPAYLDSFGAERVQGIRVNTNKITVERFLDISPFSIVPVPWTKNGFYVDAGAGVTQHPYYAAGLYYVQEPSAMLPAARLPVEEGDRVLDLCAAPGGKATELGSRLHGTGLLVANDISHSRAMALLKNLELFGIGNFLVCSETPQKLADRFGCYFDKILIDAPCSGEGMFRKDAAMVRSYLEHGPEYYAKLQREIAETAVRMLRSGGLLLYSTCTFSELENECVIEELLRAHPELSLVQMERCDGFAEGRRGLKTCIRLFPHRIQGEGHFAALIKKEGGKIQQDAETSNDEVPCREIAPRGAAGTYAGKTDELTKEAAALWEAFAAEYFPRQPGKGTERIVQREERLFLLPDGGEAPRGLRFVRTGLYLGDVKKKRFEPSQALAMYLRAEEICSKVSFAADDARVARYLKGETLELTEEEMRGLHAWCLVCVDGYPLGWAKCVNGSLRNKYYSGWRRG